MVAVFGRGSRLVGVAAWFVVVLAGWRPARAAEKVHSSDFNDPAKISNAWSVATTTLPPVDEVAHGPKKKPRRFLGEFTNETVSLSLKSLPKHDFVRVSFDLLILKNWDGLGSVGLDGTFAGPEYWGLQLDDGPLLLHAAFANGPVGIRADRRRQTFPSLLPGEHVPARTGASASNTLGYDRDLGGDTTYKLKFLIPHAADAIKFSFFGDNLPQVEEQSWGMDNVVVEVLNADEVPPPDEAAWKIAWVELGELDPVRAYEAGWKMIAARELTTETAAKFLAAIGTLPAKEQLGRKVQAFVKQLDANEFRTRERAMKDLLRLGSPAVPFLRRAWKSPPSAEARSRLELLLGRIDDVDPASLDEDARRRERLSVVLGILNTPAANNLLDKYYPDR